ncbi:MAG: diaminopimelate decarboxylase [Brevinematales bacterium]|nr:diaminopimelate decarboxylase [Brevinematales bacterium]
MTVHDVRDNKLYIGGVSAEELIREYGSPLYVYDEAIVRERYKSLSDAIPYKMKRIHYAMKANSNMHILKILKEEGAYIDAVSPYEIEIALKAGFQASKILYTGLNHTDAEIDIAMKHKVRLNIGSLHTLEVYAKKNKGAEISLRINPNIGAGHHDHTITGGPDVQFGIFESDIPAAQEIIEKSGLRLVGIQSHIGSGILEDTKFIEVMNIILPLAKRFKGLEFVDFGGGIGVPYRPKADNFNLARFGESATRMMNDFSKVYGKEITFAIEPGRYLVAESGVLLATVTDTKNTTRFRFAGVDTGFNHLIRPMVYGSYHHIVNASHMEGNERGIVVAGYLCETGDVFTRTEDGPVERGISDPKPGDILAIMTAGAYGYCMASQYNSRPRPAEVLVTDGKHRIIRRRETLDDILLTTTA